jgi:sortase A
VVRKALLLGFIGLGMFAYGAYIPAKAELAQYLIRNAWDDSISTGKEVKPWVWADMHPVMRIKSIKHNQDLIVLSGDTGNVLAFGPGFSESSFYPGQGGTAMLSGHRDTHFEFLQNVDIGEKFIVNSKAENNELIYEVTDIKIIDSDSQGIIINQNREEIKLVTCYPFNAPIAGGPLRFVVTVSLII